MPLDGDVIFGEALVSMQHITGEALPSRRARGAAIPAGSQNHDGLLVLRVTSRADDSTPARISRMAADAQARAPPALMMRLLQPRRATTTLHPPMTIWRCTHRKPSSPTYPSLVKL